MPPSAGWHEKAAAQTVLVDRETLHAIGQHDLFQLRGGELFALA